MAYGVKYRLIFSDVLGYRKKVEILKKDYTGDVLPMVGAAEPVVVQWNSKNDFYSPIIGSSCKLNLLVTDTVQYDEFYKFDEREYQVKVSYSKSISESYSDRVSNDGGFTESLECIDSALGYFYTISDNYKNRVEADGGIVESLNCVADAINDETFDVWGTYWIGWLVVDRFIEKMTTTPYNISFNAFDGLGTLSDYDAPISDDDSRTSGNGIPDNERIDDILANLDLGLDINYINDLTYQTTTGNPPVVSNEKFPAGTTISNFQVELKNDFNTFNAKEQLSLLLKLYNMRIFQSYGQWFIIEASNVFDIRVKEQIISLNEDSNPPDNIRELINLRLHSADNEFLEYTNENGTKNISVLKTVPSELVPLNNDLTREYLQPLNESERSLSNTVYGKSYWNNNSGFEYGLYGWDVTSNRAVLETDEISKKGSKSIYLNAPVGGDYECLKTIRFAPFPPSNLFTKIEYNKLESYKAQLSYFIESEQSINGTKIQFVIKYYNYDFGANNNNYWNNSTKEWQQTYYLNQVEVNNFNSWQAITINLKNIDGAFLLIGELDLQIHNTIVPFADFEYYEKTYIDNAGIYIDSDNYIAVVTNDENKNATNSNIKAIRNDGLNYSTKKSIDSILLPPESPAMANSWFRSRDLNFTNGNETVLNNPSNIANQNIMNDYREFVTRYTGSFRGLKPTPLSLHNKIWFNWPDTIEDPQSTIIDGLTYAVKSGVYKVKSHLPNNDNDLDIKVRISD